MNTDADAKIVMLNTAISVNLNTNLHVHSLRSFASTRNRYDTSFLSAFKQMKTINFRREVVDIDYLTFTVNFCQCYEYCGDFFAKHDFDDNSVDNAYVSEDLEQRKQTTFNVS